VNALLAKCDPGVTEWENNEDGSYYGAFNVRGFGEPKMLDPDTDGDELLDAEDDQDNDDVPNYSEMNLRCGDDDLLIDADNDGEVDDPNPNGANVHPYNPCAPYGGRHMPVPGFPMAYLPVLQAAWRVARPCDPAAALRRGRRVSSLNQGGSAYSMGAQSIFGGS